MRVRSWTPIAGPQIAFLITHDEAISIADYYTVRNASGKVRFPICFCRLKSGQSIAALNAGRVPTDVALRVPSHRPGGAVDSRAAGPRVRQAGEGTHTDRERDRGRLGLSRRAALRPRSQRLLVRLDAVDRGDAPTRAESERHRAPSTVNIVEYRLVCVCTI